VNREVERAKEALAAGRRDEADVHAWNALTTAQVSDLVELARIAEELRDHWLLRELEFRGVTPPQPTAAPEAKPTRRRRILWGLAILLVFLASWASSLADEPGPVSPNARDTVAQTGIGSHQMTVGTGIYLLALGRLKTIDLPKLVDELSLRYHLPIEILPPLPVTTWTLDPKHHALDADRLLALIAQSFHVKQRTTIIGLTDYELYSPSIGGRYPFSLRQPPYFAVVSTADLGGDLVDRLSGHTRHERTRKLVARDIGFLYLGLPEVDDPHSLLRGEMSDPVEIDQLRERLG
jgi:hypothetical protein